MNKSIFDSMEHLTGRVITILGILFAGIGWIGEERLRRWEKSAESLLEWEKAFRRQLLQAARAAANIITNPMSIFFTNPMTSLFLRISRRKRYLLKLVLFICRVAVCIYIAIIVVSLVLFAAIFVSYLRGSGPSDSTVRSLAWVVAVVGALGCISAGGFMVPYLIVWFLMACCWLLLFPYALTRWVEKPKALERTFIFVGFAAAIAGVFL